jgi:hypothetical protein
MCEQFRNFFGSLLGSFSGGAHGSSPFEPLLHGRRQRVLIAPLLQLSQFSQLGRIAKDVAKRRGVLLYLLDYLFWAQTEVADNLTGAGCRIHPDAADASAPKGHSTPPARATSNCMRASPDNQNNQQAHPDAVQPTP